LSNELFDHHVDPQENKTLANEIESKKTVELLSRQLHMGWKYAKPNTKSISIDED